jgi:hypothetical protein
LSQGAGTLDSSHASTGGDPHLSGAL